MVKQISRALAWISVALAIAGCANHGQQRYFEDNQAAVEQSNNITRNDTRATVYFLRAKSFANSMSANPIPLVFYAVDGTMLATMPVGSHAVLSLEPGKHVFTCIPYVSHARAVQKYRLDSEFNIASGVTYYIDANKWPVSCGSPELMESSPGREAIAKSQLVKVLHNRVSVDGFFNRVLANEQKQIGSTQPYPASSAFQSSVASFQDALPSSKQVTDVLEVIATVALIGLVIVGLGMAGGGNIASTPPPSYSSPPAVYQQSPNTPTISRPAIPALRTSSGVTTQVVNTSSEKIITNASTGVRYTVAGDRITGNDGSQYRVAGSSLFSSTGQTYQIIGNQVISNDGRSCIVTDDKVFCR